jgi:hypothetical protein
MRYPILSGILFGVAIRSFYLAFSLGCHPEAIRRG